MLLLLVVVVLPPCPSMCPYFLYVQVLLIRLADTNKTKQSCSIACA